MSFIKRNLLNFSLGSCLAFSGLSTLQLNASDAAGVVAAEAAEAPKPKLTSEKITSLLELQYVEKFIFDNINNASAWKTIKDLYKKGFTCSYVSKRYGFKVLHKAVYEANLDAVKLILQYSKDPEKELSARNKEGNTPLHCAISNWYGRTGEAQDIIESLIIAGASFDTPNNEGTTPLDMLIEKVGENSDSEDEVTETQMERNRKRVYEFFPNAFRILERGKKVSLPNDHTEPFFQLDLREEGFSEDSACYH